MESRFFSLIPNSDTCVLMTDTDGSKWKLTMIDLIDNVVPGNIISPVNSVVRKYNEEHNSSLPNTPQNIIYAFVKMAGDITSFERTSDGFSLAFNYGTSVLYSDIIKLFFHAKKVETTSDASK